MKQKIVIRVSTMNDHKSLSKVFQTATSLPGVESVTVIGADKDQVQVVGEGIDSVKLTQRLRKKVCRTELLSVGEDKKEEEAAKVEAPAPQPPVIEWYAPPPVAYNGCPYGQFVEVRAADPYCTIL